MRMSRYINIDDVLKIIEFEDKWLSQTKMSIRDIDIAFDAMKSKIKDLPTVQGAVLSVLNEIKTEIEETVLETLSDGGDDWFTSDKVNDCIEIIDSRIKELDE